MATAENAQIEYEGGQEFVDYEALTDSGNQIVFGSSEELWSRKSGKTSTVRPNGLVTGGVITVDALAEKINVAALTCYIGGALKSISKADDEAVPRAATLDYIIHSVTVTAAGAIAIVSGTEGESFSTTRGAAGGPQWIPTGSIEVGQVRFTSGDSAVVAASEIKQVVGTHVERYDFPLWEEDHISVAAGVLGSAGVSFYSSLPLVHSDDSGTTPAAKKVYAAFYTPEFVALSKASDFVPPETTHSVSSTQIYGSTIGASSSTLGQGSFTAYLNNGIDDPLVKEKNNILWFRFKSDRLADKYIYCQGTLGVSRTFGAADQIQAACTVSAEVEAVEVYA